MSLVRNVLLLGIAVMLLPAEEKSQRAQMQTGAAQAVEHTATYCERNPGTCQAGRELWSHLQKKAEQGLEFAAHTVQQQFRQSLEPSEPGPSRTAAFDEGNPRAVRQSEEPQRRRPAAIDEKARWR